MDQTLGFILLATLAGGIASVLAAALLSLTVLASLAHRLVSFATGALLGAALLNLLPEAFESNADHHVLFAMLLGGILGFFLLEKAMLWRHAHFHGVSHDHGRGGGARSGMLILVGDGLHNFADGVLIAAAFLADPALGVSATIAIIAHEIPQEVGDFMLLLHSGYSRRRALWFNLLSSLTAVLGGVLGYLVLQQMQDIVPYVLALSAASFLYIAVADLIPEMQRRWDAKEAAWQVVLIGAGVAMISLAHQH
jgi:zinc and cadmium transporter